MEVITRRRELRERAIEEAKNWAKKLPLKLTAVLIGSYARGDFNLWSDVDILLVSEDFIGGPIERLKALDIPPGYQAIPLTPKEFRRLQEKKNQLATEASEYGIILRDDLGLLRQNPGPKPMKASSNTFEDTDKTLLPTERVRNPKQNL